MKSTVPFALVATASQFSCPKPVNPVPAGPPGLCCQELVVYPLLSFLYTGKGCMSATKLDEAANGSTIYGACDAGLKAACCDPVLTELGKGSNIACVLPEG